MACLSIFSSLFSYDYLINTIALRGTLLVYSATSLALFIVVTLFLPETKNITEVQIQELFQGKSGNTTKSAAC